MRSAFEISIAVYKVEKNTPIIYGWYFVAEDTWASWAHGGEYQKKD